MRQCLLALEGQEEGPQRLPPFSEGPPFAFAQGGRVAEGRRHDQLLKSRATFSAQLSRILVSVDLHLAASFLIGYDRV